MQRFSYFSENKTVEIRNNFQYDTENIEIIVTCTAKIIGVDVFAGSEAMRITSTGNVGIGVAPESTYSAYTSIEFGQQGAIIANDAADAAR